MKHWIATGIFCAVFWTFAGNPLGLGENHPYGILNRTYETQHVKWANPFAGGKLRVLVMAPTSTQRETIELAQRLDLDYTPWMTTHFIVKQNEKPQDWCGQYFLGPESVVAEQLTKVLEKEYDVYIIGKLDWKLLSPKAQVEILRRVSKGAGVIFINPAAEHKHLEIIRKQKEAPDGKFITNGLPKLTIPGFNAEKNEVKTYRFGKGRAVIIDYGEKVPAGTGYGGIGNFPGLSPMWHTGDKAKTDPIENWQKFQPETHIFEVGYEYAMAEIARAVIWAAGKAPADFTVELPAVVKAGEAITFQAKGNVKAAVRSSSDYKKVLSVSGKTIPALPAGNWILDVWQLDENGKTINWKSTAFKVDSPVTIEKITFDRSMYNPLEKVTGKLTFTGDVNLKEVEVRMFDNLGRETARPAALKQSGNTISFELSPETVSVTLHKAAVKVSRGGKVIAEKEFPFPVRYVRLPRFVDVVWGNAANLPLDHMMLKKLAEEDAVDAMLLPWGFAARAYNTTRYNMGIISYPERYGCIERGSKPTIAKVWPKHLQDHNCMDQQGTYVALKKRISGFADALGPYAPIGYTMGDETMYSNNPDICFCPESLAALRKYLKTQYKDIADLNNTWKTSYKSFDEAVPLLFSEAQKTGNYASWIDHRMMAAETLVKFYSKAQKFMRESGDITGRVGFDGIQGVPSPNHGGNIPRLMESLELLNVYNYANTFQLRMLGDFCPENSLCGAWYGTYSDSHVLAENTKEYCQAIPYVSLFNGLRATWFWVMATPGTISGYAPDLTSLPFFQARTDSLKEIRTGIADLVLDAEKQRDPILVLHSDRSRIADALYPIDGNNGRAFRYVNSINSIETALEDSGYSFRYITEKQLSSLKDAKVLIMPCTLSVSDADAEQILAFAKNGGIVISDIVPGELDSHGAKRKKSPFADVFPSEQGKKAYGKGCFVNTGKLLIKYNKTRETHISWEKRMPLAGLAFGKLLQDVSGIAPRIKLASADGKQFPPTTRFGWKKGNVSLIGLIRDNYLYDFKPYRLNLILPESGHVYDVRAKKYLGKADNITFAQDYHAMLFAVMPSRITGYKVTVPSSVKVADKVKVSAMIQVTDGAVPNHAACRLTVKNPAGQTCKEFEQTFTVRDGKVSAELSLAFNQMPGKYTVTVMDTVSGAVGSAQFEVVK